MSGKIQKRKYVLRRVKRSSVGKRKPQVSRRRRAMKGRKMRAPDGQPERIEFSNRVEYRLNGKPHRLDGPAIEYSNGDKEWYVEGKLHRLDGPAVELADGTKEWYVEGNRHRLYGPAIEYSDGDKVWYVDGNLHREDGPAVESSNGDKCWYLYNKLHRTDGPAVEWADGGKRWYIDGKEYSEEDFEEKRQEIYKSWLLTNYAMLQRGTYHPDVSRRLLGFVTGKM